jgi:hypothetical protein
VVGSSALLVLGSTFQMDGSTGSSVSLFTDVLLDVGSVGKF